MLRSLPETKREVLYTTIQMLDQFRGNDKYTELLGDLLRVKEY
ncbi:hypothetical protein FTV88_2876 [Heliorestis convoluta]|uniref:Uncharacterized protein n=1 Tax=Heliorestis convoluta TaxID=356322 RepID=A0A5Q2N8Z6_9FIRM|nr:hypothetical protein FTV88_2876 [Heliorestis convoluta]